MLTTPSRVSAAKMAASESESKTPSFFKTIDSHIHVWASPEEAASKFSYFPGQEPALPGHVDFLLQCMEEAGVDDALTVQPINRKFDHSLVTRFDDVIRQVDSSISNDPLQIPSRLITRVIAKIIKEALNRLVQDTLAEQVVTGSSK